MKQLKEYFIQVKLTKQEKDKLEKSAKAAGMTMSQYMRTKSLYNK